MKLYVHFRLETPVSDHGKWLQKQIYEVTGNKPKLSHIYASRLPISSFSYNIMEMIRPTNGGYYIIDKADFDLLLLPLSEVITSFYECEYIDNLASETVDFVKSKAPESY